LIRNLVYVGGVGFSRFSLVLLGAIIANRLGADEYSNYVLFLTLANVINNFSVVGVVPRILSLPVDVDEYPLLRYVFGCAGNFVMSIFFVLVWCCFFDGDGNQINFLSLTLYCFGCVFVFLVSSWFNRKDGHFYAGLMWFGVSFFALLVAVIAVFFENKFFLLCFSVAWLVGSLVFGFDFLLYCFRQSVFYGVVRLVKDIPNSVLAVVYSGLFGVPFLATFFLLGNKVRLEGCSLEQPAFFLGFQLFTIATFLPGVLGGILVPRFSKIFGEAKNELSKRITFFYICFGLVWCLGAPCVREVVAYSEIHVRGPEGDGNGISPSSSGTGFTDGVDEREKSTANSRRNRRWPVHDTQMAAYPPQHPRSPFNVCQKQAPPGLDCRRTFSSDD
jgi:hypothetical protein